MQRLHTLYRHTQLYCCNMGMRRSCHNKPWYNLPGQFAIVMAVCGDSGLGKRCPNRMAATANAPHQCSARQATGTQPRGMYMYKEEYLHIPKNNHTMTEIQPSLVGIHKGTFHQHWLQYVLERSTEWPRGVGVEYTVGIEHPNGNSSANGNDKL